ncbi:GNAT family N-acetyltransferase [Virgisporangium ochraceum]|uniref:GCN5-related N-acetyltransferase n=1 Tax=Virgisporangium ochraceum TaxID=65505 RepID=A0A8J4EFF3_9ACTN|nr:GNAT family N-acetyltransferase [Virgisporangium ochraceum]GIJ73645.1 hypothetical protein Voc01_085620 [Virgisporangium ochraceum]
MTSGDDRYILRAGRASDGLDLARLQASTQMQWITGGEPHEGIAAWVEGLFDGHPSVGPEDFLVAEDVATGRPVGSLVDLRQTWTLGGVRFPVSQVELVATEPEHRGNGLTGRMFAALHKRFAADGVAIQMIEGIPYFYRRLGYDYALANDGAAVVPAAALPAGPAPLTVRPATVADADALAGIDRALAGGDAFTCPRDAGVWRYEVAGRGADDLCRRAVAVLVDGGEVRGYLVHTARLSSAGELTVLAAACARPADWPAAATAMYAYLAGVGRRHGTLTAVRPLLDPDHPLARFGPPGVPRRPRGWYVRTDDPAALLARLLPVLRARWHAADLRWPGKDLVIDLYGPAVRLEFADGELAAVTTVRGTSDPSNDPATHATVPPGALLHLALGHRTLPEILDAWPDCLVRDRVTERFLTAVFPRVPVRIWSRV